MTVCIYEKKGGWGEWYGVVAVIVHFCEGDLRPRAGARRRGSSMAAMETVEYADIHSCCFLLGNDGENQQWVMHQILPDSLLFVSINKTPTGMRPSTLYSSWVSTGGDEKVHTDTPPPPPTFIPGSFLFALFIHIWPPWPFQRVQWLWPIPLCEMCFYCR